MRILGSGNSLFVNTGYGTQFRGLLPRLRDRGHTIANFAWYGLQGGLLQLDGITMYPIGHDVWGNDIAGAYCRHFNADLFLSLMDVWVIPEDFANRLRPTLWAAWAPVDHEPIPPQVAERWKHADYPIAYSLNGYEAAKAAGIEHIRYIPHGLETATFRPLNRAESRARLGFPQEAFIASMVAANKGYPARKCFAENLQAFALFRKDHPDALLYLHTMNTTAHGGLDIPRLVGALGLTDCVRYVDQLQNHLGLPNTYMADVYNASDVLLAASAGEGFGLPIMEAQSCGCPVITTNWTAMRELTINGIATEPAQLSWSPLHSWFAVVSVANVHDALEAIYQRSDTERAREAERGVVAMRSRYDWDMCIDRYWAPFLAQVASDRAQASAKEQAA